MLFSTGTLIRVAHESSPQPTIFLCPAVHNRTINGEQAYATSDLFIQHPTKKGFWKVFGRTDDQIMHSTGEKVCFLFTRLSLLPKSKALRRRIRTRWSSCSIRTHMLSVVLCLDEEGSMLVYSWTLNSSTNLTAKIQISLRSIET